MGVASNRVARKSLVEVYGNFEIEGLEYTDFWTLGLWRCSSYSLGVFFLFVFFVCYNLSGDN